MEYTIKTGLIAAVLFSLLGLNRLHADAVTLSTHDQNPLIQPYFLPAIATSHSSGWHSTQSLYITNTLQQQSKGSESLIIDVENYRIDISNSYRQDRWQIASNLPLFYNGAGQLDSLIEDWHDFFGLPQGGRTANPNDQLLLSYSRNGNPVFFQDHSDGGLGDLSLAIAYSLVENDSLATSLSLGIEFATGKAMKNTGNDKTDTALWLNHYRKLNSKAYMYGMFGLSLPGHGGPLGQYLATEVWVSQLGFNYRVLNNINAILQLDFHSAILKNSKLKAFGNSLQMQFALRFDDLLKNHDLDLFFSEDILVRTAPDITFGLRLSQRY